MEKITEIDTHVGAAMSGLVANSMTLVDHARVEAQNHTFSYDEPIGVEALTQGMCIPAVSLDSDFNIVISTILSQLSFVYQTFLATLLLNPAVCNLAFSFGEGKDGYSSKRMSRPFGVALLLTAYDEFDGTQLFFSNPAGTFVRYKAKAIGAGSEGAQSNLNESYAENMTLEEAEDLALSTLKQVMEEKISTENIELARDIEGKGFHIATVEEVGVVLEQL